jgi:hypothetical protein
MGTRRAGRIAVQILLRISNDGGQDGDELARLATERLDVGSWADGAAFQHAKPDVALSAFFEGDAAFRDEVPLALCRSRLLEHRGHRCGAVDQLRRKNTTGAAGFVESLAEAHCVARQDECPVPDVLTVFVPRIRTDHPFCAGRINANNQSRERSDFGVFEEAVGENRDAFLIPNA